MITEINALLPQTQCGQCGFNGCLPYATALAENQANINQCPPGGDATIHTLADLLQREYQPLNPQFGEHKPDQRAKIIEENCIGCVKCIQACPVDAIIGTAKYTHTILAEECTGCALCLPPCPVDCIELYIIPELTRAEKRARALISQKRHQTRLNRHAQYAELKAQRAKEKKLALVAKMQK